MATRTSARFLTGIPTAYRVGAAAGVVAVALVIGSVLAYQIAYAGRIYPGVSAWDIDLGGRSPDEARTLLQARFDQYAQAALTLHQGAQRWQVTPAALGLSLDSTETVREVYMVGRQGSITQRLAEQYAARTAGRRIEPVTAFDEGKARAVVARLDDEVRRSPANAGLVIGADGTVQVTPSRTGVALDVPKAVAEARSAAESLKAAEVELPAVTLPVALSERELETVRERAQRMVGRPLTLTAGSRSWTLSSRDLAPLLGVVSQGSSIELKVDEAGLTAHLDRIAKEIAATPVDAGLKRTGTKIEIVPGSDGAELDVASSRTMILAQIGDATSIPLVVKRLPGLPASALADVKASTDALLSAPATFRYGDRSWLLQPANLAEMLIIQEGPAGAVPTVSVDQAKLTAFVTGVAKQIDRDPQDARFRYQGGKVSLLSEAVDGLDTQTESTAAAALAALKGPGAVVPLQVTVIRPAITSAALGQIVIRDLITEASTSYAGAIPAKVHNIQLAASRLNGTVVPPGGTFSFNRALGPATLASGFQVGYGIMVNSRGQMETIPSEAGGICQVATTLFQSVFWAGYPIAERNWHLYWITRYGQPPRGMKGLDATVDDAYGVDFKFRNNTSDWIAVEASAGGGTLRFGLRGVKPTWKVTVAQPRITNVVPANRELVRQSDGTMPVGQTLMVEAAEDGFDVAIDRTVTQDDQVVDQWTARSHYRPSRNVLLVGTKPVTPTPTPSATPQPQATPAPGIGASPTPPAAGTPRPGQTPTKTP